MNEYKGVFYDGVRVKGGVYENLEFRSCSFDSCVIGVGAHAENTVLRNIKLTNCSVVNCVVSSVVAEDVWIEGLKTAGKLFQLWGGVFRHVTLKGPIDRVMLSDRVMSAGGGLTPRADLSYYSNVDWALDISQADFRELDIRGVPARLIRRDPETQVVVTAAKAVEFSYAELDYGDTHWQTAIEFMLERGEPDVVLVAPKRSPKFKVLLEKLKMLRAEGIAELD